jgi:hypothetical protein
MPTVAYTKFQPGAEGLVEGVNAGTDTFVIKLASAVNAAAGTFTEVANGNGYTTGGNTCGTNSTATHSGGTYTVTLTNPATWTATGAVGPFQYAVLVDSTASINLGYWDYGSAVNLATGDTFQFTFSGGAFTVA